MDEGCRKHKLGIHFYFSLTCSYLTKSTMKVKRKEFSRPEINNTTIKILKIKNSSVNKDSSTFSFSNLDAFPPLFWLIFLALSYRTILNRNGEN